MVERENQDRFFISASHAAKACANLENQLQKRDQLRDLTLHLGQWLESRGGKIREAFLVGRQDGFLFLVVQKDSAYDRQLEHDLTSLEMAVADSESFNLLYLDVLALPSVPRESLESFLPLVGASEDAK